MPGMIEAMSVGPYDGESINALLIYEGENDVRVSEVTGKELDFLVAKCRGIQTQMWQDYCMRRVAHSAWGAYRPSTRWNEGGPIIEQEKIILSHLPDSNDLEHWSGRIHGMEAVTLGETPLIAAMRCYVYSKLGEEVT